MLIPLSDGMPLRRIPFQLVTASLIIACVIVQLQIVSLPGREALAAILAFGTIPAVLLGDAQLPAALERVPPILTLVTYAFLHGDWMHLFGNMIFLWVLGDNVEDAFGHRRFLVFYLLCAAVASLAHTLAEAGSTVPLVGASGAVSGVVAAYLMLYPRQKMWALLFGKIPVRFRTYWLLGGWIGMQVMFIVIGDDSNVAWFAHVGGLVAGAVLTPLLKPRDVALFAPEWAAPPKPEVLARAPGSRMRPPRTGGGGQE